MIWIKSVFAGFAAAIATVVAIVIATTVWFISMNDGSGGIGFFSVGVPGLLLFPAALAFALAFRWTFRRQHQRRLL